MKISIGGMIASGKSQLSKKLSEELKIPIVEEFKENDVVFNTMLEWLYTRQENVEMLLQIYFIHNQLMHDRVASEPFIVDRDLFERKIFADANLSYDKETLEIYNQIFELYVDKIKKPTIYIILKVSWDEFKKRIFARGRKQEIDNFDQNEQYFKQLNETYVEKLVNLCIKYNVNYKVIDTDNLTISEVYDLANNEIKKIRA